MQRYAQGEALFHKHLYEAAYQIWNDALSTSDALEYRLNCLKAMGVAQFRMGRYHQAYFLTTVARKWSEELPGADDVKARLTLNQLSVLGRIGHFEEGLSLAEEAGVRAFRGAERPSMQVDLQWYRALFLKDTGHPAEAEALLAGAIADQGVGSDQRLRLETALAQLRLLRNDPEGAEGHLARARDLLDRATLFKDRMDLFITDAETKTHKGEVQRAAELLRDTIGLVRQAPRQFDAVEAARMVQLAAPLVSAEHPDSAERALEWSRSTLARWGRAHQVAEVSGRSAPLRPELQAELVPLVDWVTTTPGFLGLHPGKGQYLPLVYSQLAISPEFNQGDVQAACLGSTASSAFTASGVATVIRTYARYLDRATHFSEAVERLSDSGHRVNPRLAARLVILHLAA